MYRILVALVVALAMASCHPSAEERLLNEAERLLAEQKKKEAKKQDNKPKQNQDNTEYFP